MYQASLQNVEQVLELIVVAQSAHSRIVQTGEIMCKSGSLARMAIEQERDKVSTAVEELDLERTASRLADTLKKALPHQFKGFGRLLRAEYACDHNACAEFSGIHRVAIQNLHLLYLALIIVTFQSLKPPATVLYVLSCIVAVALCTSSAIAGSIQTTSWMSLRIETCWM